MGSLVGGRFVWWLNRIRRGEIWVLKMFGFYERVWEGVVFCVRKGFDSVFFIVGGG